MVGGPGRDRPNRGIQSLDSLRRAITDRRVILTLTFVVAFCSIAYELVYSELLTVFYGGTVLRYSITIGLYMFSMGVGAFLSSSLDESAPNFFRTEVYLAIAGPMGAFVIIGLNSAPDLVFPGKRALTLGVAHVPILVVGLLSGLEIPLLDDLLPGRSSGGWLASIGNAPERVLRRVLAVPFSVSPPERRGLSAVLGVDYLGGLAGTVGYALVLYPRYGLVVTILVLGLLNAIAALGFVAWGLRSSTSIASPTAGRWRAVLAVGLLVAATCGGAVVQGEQVDRTVTGAYLADRIEREYPPGVAEVSVTGIRNTPYQRITTYTRRIEGHAGPERCLRLDRADQLCDRWVDSYHAGLIDIPMAARSNPAATNVLLIGGGDFIAVDRLREYGVSVDQVDIDGEFMAYARSDPTLTGYNDDASAYENLTTTVGDARQFLRETDETYDLIVLDVPGARSDDSLGLYSREFYASIRTHLSPSGMVVTWAYSPYRFGEHSDAYLRTVRAAGFDRYLPYWVYEDPDGDGERERGELFYVLADGPRRTPDLDRAKSDYIAANRDRLGPFEWKSIPRLRGVDPNSVFDPNYRVIVG